MQSFDVLVLGAGETGTRIAVELRKQNLTIALVALPGNDEDYFRRLIGSVSARPIAADGQPAAPEPGIAIIHAKTHPRFLDERHVAVDDEKIHFKHAVLATGCKPRAAAEARRPVTPVDFFHAPSYASPVNVWGAGPTGVCAAMKIARGGGQAFLISKQDRVLPNEDETMSDFATQELQRAGVRIVKIPDTASSGNIDLLCAGLDPHSNELNLRGAFIYADPTSGRVQTDELMRTSNPQVYAAGPVTGPPFHLNFERFQTDLIVENLNASIFMKHRFMPEEFPTMIPFSTPLARLGLTERNATKKFKDALAITRTIDGGFVKLIALKRSGLLVGAHAAGDGADGLILLFDLMLRAEITLRDIAERHHFPTSPLSDAVADAVESWIGLAGR